jgi:AraC-like DNA-binding protein
VGEFASALLMAAVQRALADDGIEIELPRTDGALLPLATKRRILAAVADLHGLLPLLRVGRILSSLPPDPAISALTSARDPFDLFERWRRLERFTHSRHRVVHREDGPRRLVVEHVGPPTQPPTAAEDAVVLGLLTALLAAIGARGLTATLTTPTAALVYAHGEVQAPPTGHGTHRWEFAWTAVAPARGPDGAADVAGSAVRRLLHDDLGRRWTLRALAEDLGTSTRSLQRQLRETGGFSTLLSATRAHAAAELLMTTDHPLGVVGFACGYADQPHFTRDFKRRTAMTPAAYRSAFTAHPLSDKRLLSDEVHA